ncbi:hypothetical protein VPH35_060175 [Triticum aestivum]
MAATSGRRRLREREAERHKRARGESVVGLCVDSFMTIQSQSGLADASNRAVNDRRRHHIRRARVHDRLRPFPPLQPCTRGKRVVGGLHVVHRADARGGPGGGDLLLADEDAGDCQPFSLAEQKRTTRKVGGIIPHLVDGGVSILQYANDTIIFMEHDLGKARNIKFVLCLFEQLFGLQINFNKTPWFVHDVSVPAGDGHQIQIPQEPHPHPLRCPVGAHVLLCKLGAQQHHLRYARELFPTRVQSTCHAISAASRKTGTVAAAYGVQSLILKGGVKYMKQALSVTNMLGLFFTFLDRP